MSFSNRRGKSVAKLAAALCVLSTGGAPAVGGDVPRLIKTTAPIRVDSFPIHDGNGSWARSAKKAALARDLTQTEPSLAPIADDAEELRMLLDPQGLPKSNSHIRQTAGGQPRTNHFVELQSDGPIDITDRLPAARSAAVPQRTRTTRGVIKKNPLIVDAPPELRRFQVEDLPFVMPTIQSQSSADGALVVREQPLPPQPVADLDDALDLLSAETSPAPAILGTARNSGFGTLAIDQIGGHLEHSSSAEYTMDYPPLGRFATDLVLPPGQPLGLHTPGMASSFREQLGAIHTGSLIEDTASPLPPPTDSAEIDAIAKSLQVLGQGVSPTAGTAAMELASKDNGERVALEVEELLAASSEQPNESESDQDTSSSKPSLAEKFVGWSKKLTSGRTSSKNKAVSTRLPGEPTGSRAAPQPRKRSGGILTQWLNKSR